MVFLRTKSGKHLSSFFAAILTEYFLFSSAVGCNSVTIRLHLGDGKSGFVCGSPYRRNGRGVDSKNYLPLRHTPASPVSNSKPPDGFWLASCRVTRLAMKWYDGHIHGHACGLPEESAQEVVGSDNRSVEQTGEDVMGDAFMKTTIYGHFSSGCSSI